MLNIPDSIKALYLADTDPYIRRNFRVHFPNGELPDINNDQIVSESMQLTESIMSQNTFKFGLAEAPQISFETVGVGNMMGLTIECSHEIETSSLTAAQISDIQADTWDGELVLVADSDLGYGFFRVPLGTFVVNSCQRNHGAMTHRRIVAYGADNASGDDGNAYSFERFKWSNYYEATTAKIDIALWIYSTLGIILPGKTVTKTTEAMVLNVAGINLYRYAPQSGFGVQVQVTLYNPSDASSGGVYSFDIPEMISEDELRLNFEDAWTAAGMGQYVSDAIKEGAFNSLRTMRSPRYLSISDGATSGGAPAYYSIAGATRDDTFYLQRPGTSDYCGVNVAYSFRVVRLYNGNTSQTSSYYPIYATIPEATKHTLSSAGIEYTLAPTGSLSAQYQRPNTFNGALPFADLSLGVLEIYGAFGRASRTGKYNMVTIDDSSPCQVQTNQYSEMWYDEYDVSAIGTIIYTYTDTNDGGKTITLNLNNDGQSVYDLSGNFILNTIPGTQSEAEDIINACFIPNINNVDFTPIEMTAKGMPWIEVGDALEVTTEDNETVISYMLERILTGIQILMDSIKSTGGELISADTAGYGS